MANETSKDNATQPMISIPGLAPVPVVAIRLPDGTIALRHPSELVKNVPAAPAAGDGK